MDKKLAEASRSRETRLRQRNSLLTTKTRLLAAEIRALDDEVWRWPTLRQTRVIRMRSEIGHDRTSVACCRAESRAQVGLSMAGRVSPCPVGLQVGEGCIRPCHSVDFVHVGSDMQAGTGTHTCSCESLSPVVWECR